jgi:hypothetical protein
VLIGSLLLLVSVAISAFLPAPGVPSLTASELLGRDFPGPRARGTERLEGQLFGADGEPRAGYLLVAEHQGRLVHARSATDGRFVLEELAAGTLDLAILGPELPLCNRRVDVPSAKPVRLTLDPTLPPLPTVPAIERSDLLGRVTLAFSLPTKDYELWLLPLPELEVGDFKLGGLSGAVERRVTIDADGLFRVPELVHGRYGVSLLPPWAAGGEWPLLVELALDHRGSGIPMEISSQTGQIRAQLRDQDGRPVIGARLEVREAGREQHLWPPAFSGNDGRLVLNDLPAGSYRASLTSGDVVRQELVRINALRSTELDWSPLQLGSQSAGE